MNCGEYSRGYGAAILAGYCNAGQFVGGCRVVILSRNLERVIYSSIYTGGKGIVVH